MARLGLITIAFALLTEISASAATIVVTPSDSYQKIESAKAGDVVEIAPGTYRFRVTLSQKGTAEQPIIIRAQDPKNRPVWDLQGKTVDQWPGSYTGGDANRGAWQLRGAAYYTISGLVIRNATNGTNSAAVRLVDPSNDQITFRNCLFELNDNGITGGGQNIALEFCELRLNGSANYHGHTHNLYWYSGSLTVRHCFIHDSTHGQNFHIRAREALIENSWIARAQNYEGDMMTSAVGEDSSTLTLLGNVIIQNTAPENRSKIFALYNDTGRPNVRMHLNLFYNTIIGNGGTADLVGLHNNSMVSASATMTNNIVYGLKSAMRHDANATWAFSGSNNWFPEGSNVASLTNTTFGTNPGFRDLAQKNYQLLDTAQAVSKANPQLTTLPIREYFRDEVIAMRYRNRLNANDLGAFEHTTTGPDFGPDDSGGDLLSPSAPQRLRMGN